MGSIKEMNIKNRTYYFFDNMIGIKDFNPDVQNIDRKSYKNIDIYYIGNITMKDFEYVKINSVNPLIHWRYIEEKNGNKYLTLVSTDKNKEVLIKYTELWDKIKNTFKKINDRPGDCDEIYTKIKFNSDDNLTLNKILKLHNLTIVARSVFQEDNKTPKIF